MDESGRIILQIGISYPYGFIAKILQVRRDSRGREQGKAQSVAKKTDGLHNAFDQGNSATPSSGTSFPSLGNRTPTPSKMSNMGSQASYRRDQLETSQWEDLHSKHKTEGYEYVKAIRDERKRIRKEDWVNFHHDEAGYGEDKEARDENESGSEVDSDDEMLKELENDDASAVSTYRAKRIAEMRRKAAMNKFGDLYRLAKEDYVREMTEGSKDKHCVLLLHQENVRDSKTMETILKRLAQKNRHTKFFIAKADHIIENFPDFNVPTVICYHEGKMISKFERLAAFGGKRMRSDDVEWQLAQIGAVNTELEMDPQLTHGIADAMDEAISGSLADA
jgi:hypothetical protein